MSELVIHDELAERLRNIARHENRPVEDVLSRMLDVYATLTESQPSDLLAAMDGMFDDDVSDLSTTVRETMAEYYRKKYGNPD